MHLHNSRHHTALGGPPFTLVNNLVGQNMSLANGAAGGSEGLIAADPAGGGNLRFRERPHRPGRSNPGPNGPPGSGRRGAQRRSFLESAPRVKVFGTTPERKDMGGSMSDLENQARKDLEQDPDLKQDAEKQAEQQGQDIEQNLKKDL